MEDAESLQVGSQPTPHEVNTMKTILEDFIAYAENAERYSPRGPSETKTPPTNDISKRSHSGSRSKVALSQLLVRLEK